MASSLHTYFAKDLENFKQCLDSLCKDDFPLTDQIVQHLFHHPGKQIRPLLVLASHSNFLDKAEEKAYLSAALIEIIHTASLMHDDVVDNAAQRRGKPSIPFIFGNKATVLAGDYLLTNAILKSFDPQDLRLLLVLIRTIKEMSQGELLQMDNIGNIDLKEDVYEKIIEYKTAALFASCCECGAFTANASLHDIENMRLAGLHLGLAFQMQDDRLDYLKNVESGKTYGNDLREKKVTLPLLRYLQICPIDERHAVISFFNGTQDSAMFAEKIIEKVVNSSALEYVNERIEKEKQKAIYYAEQIKNGKRSDVWKQLADAVLSGF